VGTGLAAAVAAEACVRRDRTLPDVNDLEVELSDFDAAIRCLETHADDADVVRRSIRAALDHLYSLEANQPDGYWGRVERSDDGQVCAGLTFIRGRAVHRLLRGHEYEILVPSEALAPSEYVAPGGNWRWLDWDDLDDELRVDEKAAHKEQNRQWTRRKYVRAQVQGRLVRQTFAEARRFLFPDQRAVC
jgi:hypothetical protein